MHLKSKKLNKETEKKIEKLLCKMTLEEKVGQLNQSASSPVGAFEISKDELKKCSNREELL